MAIIEPSGLEKEENLDIPVSGNVDCRVVSGYANFVLFPVNNIGGPTPANDAPSGSSLSDAEWEAHEVHMVVGPRWRAVRDVSPSVSIAGYKFDDSDEADDSGFHIDTCEWDTVGLPPPDTNFEKIRLKVNLRARGGRGFDVTKLSYQLVAVGIVN